MKKIFLIALILFFISSSIYASNDTLFKKDEIYTITFNTPISLYKLNEGAITFKDERGLSIPFDLKSGDKSNQLMLIPKKELEPGVFYYITVHKGKVFSDLPALKNDYSRQIALDFETALALTQKIYDNAREGSSEGDYSYGSKKVFRETIHKLTNQIPIIKTEFEKNLWTKDLGDAIKSFENSKIIGETGTIYVDPTLQEASSLSFTYQFNKDRQVFIENNLLGFEIALDIEQDNNRIFIHKSYSKNSVPEAASEFEMRYVYENIDASLIFQNLNGEMYVLKIKPLFKDILPTAIPYNMNSRVMVPHNTFEGGSAKYLSWVNMIEIPKTPGTVRYMITFKAPFDELKISLDHTQFKEINYAEINGEKYLLTPLNKSGFIYWNAGENHAVIKFLEENKNNSPHHMNIVYFDANGRILNNISNVPIQYITDKLPKIETIYNLTQSQEESILNPNKEYEIVVINRGDLLRMHSRYPSKLHAFKILLDNTSDFDWEIILKNHVETIRYKDYENGTYEEFREKLLDTSGQLLISETPIPSTKIDYKNIDDKYIIELDTLGLAKGQYFFVIEDDNGLYYPIENMVVNLIEEETLHTISNIRYENGFIKFKYTPLDSRIHNISAYVLTESQYLEFKNSGDERLLKYWANDGRLIGEVYNGSVYIAEDVSMKLKDIPRDEYLYIILFDDNIRDMYEVKKVYLR